MGVRPFQLRCSLCLSLPLSAATSLHPCKRKILPASKLHESHAKILSISDDVVWQLARIATFETRTSAPSKRSQRAPSRPRPDKVAEMEAAAAENDKIMRAYSPCKVFLLSLLYHLLQQTLIAPDLLFPHRQGQEDRRGYL